VSRWQDRAECVGRFELFYPPSGEQPYQAELREQHAGRLCAACPVLTECLAAEFAETHKAQDIDGYRAGMPAARRRTLFRNHHGLAKGERMTPMRKAA
jgi:hypothetical protein